MIPNIVRGTRVGGLIRYLYGPGKREEHVNPHLVAAWDGAGRLSTLEPPVGVDGKRDFRQLIDVLEQPVHNGGNPPRKPVWHCSVRTDPTDRWLTDAQWAHIGGEVMAAVGLAPRGDPRGVRWVAIRHGPDHIHIVATLVRQDRRTAWGRNDYWLAQAACRDLEQRYGLRRLGPADRTGHRRPTAPELNKARRAGREPTRDRLRREVRFAAATAGNEGEFFALLHQAGLLVRSRASSIHPEQVTGYAVAVPNDAKATGEPVWYSGGKLAPDLTLPQLRHRWGQPDGPPKVPPLHQADIYQQAAAQVRAAADQIGARGGDPVAASAVAYAAADTLTAAARLVEGQRRGLLHRAAEAMDRATRVPYRQRLPRTGQADGLRAMSRLLRLAGQLTGAPELFALRRLLVEMVLLAQAVAELRQAQHRLHQARAARSAARLLQAATAAGPGPVDRAPSTVTATSSPTPPRDARRQDRREGTGRTR